MTEESRREERPGPGEWGPRRPAGPEASRDVVVLTIDTSPARADIPSLCERLDILLTDRSPPDGLVCAVEVYAEPDVVLVEALARMQLTARRLGAEVRIRRAPCLLYRLLALTGLDEVVGPSRDSWLV